MIRPSRQGAPARSTAQRLAGGPTWSSVLRRWAWAGARHGPGVLLQVAPPAIGLVAALLQPSVRRRVRENHRLALGRRPWVVEARDVARTFVAFAHCLTEALAAGRAEAERATPRVVGWERLAAAAAGGRGVIVLTAHVGGWDAGSALLARDLGRPVLVVMRPEADAGARAVSDAARRRGGVRVLHGGGGPHEALALLASLRAGGIVALQLDRAPREVRTLPCELFGEPYAVPDGPFRLAALSGAPIALVLVRRIAAFDYEVDVRAVLRVERQAGRSERAAAASSVLRELEAFIRAHPTQWFDFG
ncbi:MAG: lysophospholipid acyltransferase family protein [Polyangiaceae bacterium]|nr:lysophospholipid acyltransferase family protein [Polyangiaceae bacterium]